MLWSRRRFLGSAAAITVLGCAGGSPRPARADDEASLVLRATPGTVQCKDLRRALQHGDGMPTKVR